MESKMKSKMESKMENMMEKDNILEIISKFAKVDKISLSDNIRFKEDLHLDSIDLFQIIVEIEEKYNIKLETEDLMEIKTIGNALDKVAKYKK